MSAPGTPGTVLDLFAGAGQYVMSDRLLAPTVVARWLDGHCPPEVVISPAIAADWLIDYGQNVIHLSAVQATARLSASLDAALDALVLADLDQCGPTFLTACPSCMSSNTRHLTGGYFRCGSCEHNWGVLVPRARRIAG